MPKNTKFPKEMGTLELLTALVSSRKAKLCRDLVGNFDSLFTWLLYNHSSDRVFNLGSFQTCRIFERGKKSYFYKKKIQNKNAEIMNGNFILFIIFLKFLERVSMFREELEDLLGIRGVMVILTKTWRLKYSDHNL